MIEVHYQIIQQAYEQFNDRNIDGVLVLMQPDVEWPNGWEGGYIKGREAVRDYWTRQWKELDPVVKPVSYKQLAPQQVQVEVHQLIKDMKGNVLADGIVSHIYTFNNELISSMEIREM